MKTQADADLRSRGWVLILIVVVLLGGLPIAVWLDLRNLSENLLRIQAGDLNSIITSVREYYTDNVVGRVLAAPGSTQVVHNYMEIPGAIPIPATLSLELGGVISARQSDITYRFVSDFPFKGRAPHVMDDFERAALASLRQNPRQGTGTGRGVADGESRRVGQWIGRLRSRAIAGVPPELRNQRRVFAPIPIPLVFHTRTRARPSRVREQRRREVGGIDFLVWLFIGTSGVPMADDNIAVTDLDPDVAATYAAIDEAREQALRLQQRLRGVAAFIGRARPPARRQPHLPRRDRR